MILGQCRSNEEVCSALSLTEVAARALARGEAGAARWLFLLNSSLGQVALSYSEQCSWTSS